MQTRCYRCGFSFAISQGNLAAAMADLIVTETTHYVVHCPRCRSANKIDRQTVARFAPPVTEEALAAARAAVEAAAAEPERQTTPEASPAPPAVPEEKKKKRRRRRRSQH